METSSIAALIGFLIPWVSARQMSAAAVGRLPDQDKVMLVNVASRGRRYLWLYVAALAVAAVLIQRWFLIALVGMMVLMIAYNHFWVRRSSLPDWYKSRHLITSTMSVAAFFLAWLFWYAAKVWAL